MMSKMIKQYGLKLFKLRKRNNFKVLQVQIKEVEMQAAIILQNLSIIYIAIKKAKKLVNFTKRIILLKTAHLLCLGERSMLLNC